MLQNGAAKVYAVDVGYNQLDWRLRTDPRVVCMERTNARYLSPELIPEPLDFASVDVSFISLNLILPRPAHGDGPGGAGGVPHQAPVRGRAGEGGKKGVVRDPAVHLEVLEHFLDHAAAARFTVLDVSYSPIRGPEGNIEYLGYLSAEEGPGRVPDLKELVEQSHRALEVDG